MDRSANRSKELIRALLLMLCDTRISFALAVTAFATKHNFR